MISLVDTHCHLLAGLDDGPRTDEDALAMCRIACADGVRLACATAHQNERYSAVTPERIRSATRRLAEQVRAAGLPLAVYPCAEVMLWPDLEAAWDKGDLVGVADGRRYLLLEMPHGLFVDVTGLVRRLVAKGVRPILAHPERHPELLEDSTPVEELIRAGCLVQVCAGSVTSPRGRREANRLRGWFRRGLVHLLGSDGHSPRSRRPLLAAAYEQIAAWAGPVVADRVGSTNGLAVLHGLTVRVAEPKPRQGWRVLFGW